MNRRELLVASSAGVVAGVSGCIDQIQGKSGDGSANDLACEGSGDVEDGDYPAVALDAAPEPYEESGANDSEGHYGTHPLEYDSLVDRIEEYNETRDPSVLYNPYLAETLADKPDRERFRLHARTLGERVQVESEERENPLYGFAPTDCEVETLREFGEVTYVPDFASTKVSLAEVERDDVPQVAALSFVIEVNFAPEGGNGDE